MEQKRNEQYRDDLIRKLKESQELIKKIKEKHGGKYETLDSSPKRYERKTVWTLKSPLNHKNLKSLVECLTENGYRLSEIRTTATKEPIGVEVRSLTHENIDRYIACSKYYNRSFDDIIINDEKYTTVIALVNHNAVGIMMDTDEVTLSVKIRTESDSLQKNEDAELAKRLICDCLHIVDNMIELDATRDISPMACVYASPEIMSEMSKPIANGQTYPYIHAVQDDSEDKHMMGNVYGSPEMMDGGWKFGKFPETQTKSDKAEFCGHCGKQVDNGWAFCSLCGNAIQMVDPEVTIGFCQTCGRSNRLDSKYCVYCGNEMRAFRPFNEPSPPMGCVYASPQRMSITPLKTSEKKEGFFKRLFRGGTKNE